MSRPTIDEQLDAAAHRIVNDGHRHEFAARIWAERRLAAAYAVRVSAHEQRVAKFFASRRRREW